MLRRPDPRDNPTTVLAAVTVGLMVFLVPPKTAPLPAAPVFAAPAVAVPAQPAALPVQKVVIITAQPTVLSSAAPARGDPTVSLTFDDGPDPAWTPQVLELLRQHSAVATFCVVGNQARKHPELLRDIVPGLSVVGLLLNPANPNAELELNDTEVGARSLGLKLVTVRAGSTRRLLSWSGYKRPL